MSQYEFIATVTGLVAVWLTIKQNKWCFPIGIFSSLVYFFIFFDSSVRFYADAVLQLIYVVLLIYGWIRWTEHSKVVQPLQISFLKNAERLACLLVLATSTTIIWLVLKNYTNAAMPFLDAFTTSLSLLAQWMVANKKTENWYLWIMTNILYVYMYVQKELEITSVYYFILLILAVKGLGAWKKYLKNTFEKNVPSFNS
jgi:nicotinamide mononucleotide transporter